MKRLVSLLIAALAAAAVTFGLVSLWHAPHPPSGPDPGGLAWIRTEFGLSDEQFAAVRRLHEDYSMVCGQHCADIAGAVATLAEVRRSSAGATEITAAERRVAELEAVCNDATRAHLRRVAAAMPAGQGERFLRLVEPHLAQLPHDPASRSQGR